MRNIPEDEQALLAEVAKSRGISLEELLAEIGKGLPETPFPAEAQLEEDPVVVFSGGETPVEAVPLPPAAEEPDAPTAADNDAEVTDEPEKATIYDRFDKCVHCGWNQDDPVIETPTREEAIDFLHCVLGRKLYSRDYSILDGRMIIRFRSLHIRELEAIYDAASRAQASGLIKSQGDHYEYINRLRIYLQVRQIRIRLHGNETLSDLPDILNSGFLPNSGTSWLDKLKADGLYNTSFQLLDQVCDYMKSHVLNTEHLHRLVAAQCARFNRHVAMLEVRMDDANFWKEIGTPM